MSLTEIDLKLSLTEIDVKAWEARLSSPCTIVYRNFSFDIRILALIDGSPVASSGVLFAVDLGSLNILFPRSAWTVPYFRLFMRVRYLLIHHFEPNFIFAKYYLC